MNMLCFQQSINFLGELYYIFIWLWKTILKGESHESADDQSKWKKKRKDQQSGKSLQRDAEDETARGRPEEARRLNRKNFLALVIAGIIETRFHAR